MVKLWIGFCCFLLSVGAFADNAIRVHALPKTVALTFDDGPSPVFTPQVLAILKKYNVKATFFAVGASAKQYPYLIKQILADGHAIGDHSMTHPMLTKLSDAALYNEVVGSDEAITNAGGIKPLCLRYPFGASNSHVRAYIRAHGMTPVSMGFNSFDYDRPGKEKIVSWILKNVHSGQVFLFHDGYFRREQTVAALPEIIEGIKAQGYGFSVICDNAIHA